MRPCFVQPPAPFCKLCFALLRQPLFASAIFAAILTVAPLLSDAVLTVHTVALRAAEPALNPGPSHDIDFNRDIRPLLSENCFYCHGQDENKREAGLRLDLQQSAIDARAVLPKDSENSLLIERINSQDADTLMPPPESNRRLNNDQKELLRQWIEQGAQYQTHWAFAKPTSPAEPDVGESNWPRNSIDKFVLAKLSSGGLQPSAEAPREILIKRLYADLIGLPPSPQQVQDFLNDSDPQAYENLVERLLENRHYGERMALPWLDAARYADSNGFQQDGDTWQWIWRDWVVDALNRDMPFDQFTIWQLAGDLLPSATDQQKIASAFNRNHLLNGEGGAIAEEQRFNVLFDRIDTTATTWLGLTMACAQCHDHKYDPISQRDYYQLLDAFNRVPESGTPQFYSKRIRVGNPVLELLTEENKARIADFESQISALAVESAPAVDLAFAAWKVGIAADGNSADTSDLPQTLIDPLKKPAEGLTDEDKAMIETELRKHFDAKVKQVFKDKIPQLPKIENLTNQLNSYKSERIPRVMVMSDDRPRETHILDRGQYLQPLDKVAFDTPGFLPPLPDDAPKNRLGFARWLVSPENPLTARVQVNRMWQHFFGTGLVKTTEDFGVQSEYPLHKDLLDWLAIEFQNRGWSMKAVHRLIVTSATYRQSSRISDQLREMDIENRLYARASRFRMPAMLLRDWALATSGLLNTEIGGQPVYPYQPDAVWESLAITKERDFTYPISAGDDLYRRSLYTFWRRTVNPANMFDASSRQTCQVRTSITSTPLHALTTLNDPTWVEAARNLAQVVMLDSDQLDVQLGDAFQRILTRQPSDQEMQVLQESYEKQLRGFEKRSGAAAELLAVGQSPRDAKLAPLAHAALTMVCLGMYNFDEALTRQ